MRSLSADGLPRGTAEERTRIPHGHPLHLVEPGVVSRQALEERFEAPRCCRRVEIDISSEYRKDDIHDGRQVMHIFVMLRAQRVLSGREELVDLRFELVVRVPVTEEAAEDAREGARGRICARNHRENAIVYELLD